MCICTLANNLFYYFPRFRHVSFIKIKLCDVRIQYGVDKQQECQPKNQVIFRPAKSPRLEGKNIKDILGSLNDWKIRKKIISMNLFY